MGQNGIHVSILLQTLYFRFIEKTSFMESRNLYSKINVNIIIVKEEPNFPAKICISNKAFIDKAWWQTLSGGEGGFHPYPLWKRHFYMPTAVKKLLIWKLKLIEFLIFQKNFKGKLKSKCNLSESWHSKVISRSKVRVWEVFYSAFW